MSTSAGAEQRAKPPGRPRALGLPALALLSGVALGHWGVSTLTSSPDPRAVTSASAGSPSTGPVDARPEQVADAPAAGGHDRRTVTTTASPERFTRLTGLEVLRVSVTGSGGILDLRYRAVDSDRAAERSGAHPASAIIDARTGTHLTTQWMGHAHPPRSFRPDRHYWMLFLNEDDLVARGDVVSVHLGPAILTGVAVG